MFLLPGKDTTRGGTTRGGMWRRRLLLVAPAALVASLAVLPIGGCVPAVAQAHAAAQVTVPDARTVAARPDDEQLAVDTLDEVTRGDFTAVSARFDEALRGQATPEFLANSWNDYQKTFGRFESHGDPKQVASGNGNVVDVPLHMAKRPGDFRVTFNTEGQIVGLFFLRTGVPVP
ncbi:hypothetical protein GCM10010347_55660 [Streptomyces cirratus]|uniref:DUF3887 domain-containing protein n=2 Tax=Streptomyces cirratus TaxID=68187 RepID=A0ABQ3F000_9ACTN|nr:hypothetical protein GCM10010347_55660 [Streptomyces cirratus]